MSKVLRQPAPCSACGNMIEAGHRADRSGAGHTATFRHWNGICPKGTRAVAVQPAADLATERQVRYALDLQSTYWSPAVFGGRRYPATELAEMSRSAISGIIDTLEHERSL